MLILWRRRHPLWLLVGTVVLQVTCRGLVGVEDNLLLFFALFAVAQRASAKTAWLGFAGAAAVITTVGFLYDTSLDGFVTLTPILVTWALAVAIFVHFGNRRRYVQALVELAKHLARERDQAAQIAAAEERARIARELHDVVAHSLAVMVTLSDGAVAVAETDPTAAKSTMVKVSETGRDAVSDMRRLLAVLRSSADRSPQPGAADLMPLVDSFRQTGLPVELELKASFPAHQALALAIYRIVQESLTNVLRYARSTPKVEVQVTAPRPGVYQVVVENAAPTALVLGSSPDREPADGQASDGVREGGQTAAEAAAGAELSRTWDGAGRGILGMTERAALFGGQLTAGPTKSGGWRVEATLEADH
jgi:signal transduction histidine kinase